ncbi:nuclear transport factor 2 family protein [Sphingomonas sp. BT-65]|uniref:nuclear transport factor 2 family protein n=1 Tax=Sphingomonas sp. BT-65 TaxID=2989821 RepID=UPI0022368F71|nr:nuclear transport factor 2 family protein [Sphingomonas sp. BT-65]MCW4462638.1 nuclear transport factor 2 family protein [Sphingomonas sp. BT-65]
MDNAAIVAAAWEAFASRDADRIAACFAPEAEWIAPPGNATAVALDYPYHMRGAEEIARFIATEFGRLFVADVVIDFRTMAAAGDLVTVEERMRATLVNGRSYDLPYCFVFVVAGGRITQVREYMDTRSGWRQMFGDEPGRKLVD